MNKYNQENPRFWELELAPVNKKDLQHWVDDNKLVALVDEKQGGIIGYINRKHITKIAKMLNGRIIK